ncbi:caspase family protein [Flammeovirga sp. SubArs3]|uniref:caspase family protein n=1 Tax=Flammeovirga sp. SubArs3 TaxID=2995316 RepID=UPI00248B6EC1|nr:caspase family protein [Flammeovirga sp. SubArs3]
MLTFKRITLLLTFTFFSLLLFAQEQIDTNSTNRGLTPKIDNYSSKITDSRKYALIIGSDQYEGKPMWSDLKNAEYDATSMKELLEVKYNFETELLLSPTKNDVLKTIISYHDKLKRDDRFLVFIAGHGDYDKTIYNDGFLVFKDTKPSTEDFARSTYLAYNQLNGILNSLPSKHVGIILDVCFGGTFNNKVNSYRSGNKVYDSKSTTTYAKQKLAKKSRLFLTSGALEPVPDGYAEKHSPFCYLLLDALENGDKNGHPITLSWLHQQAQLNITESMYGFFGDNQPGSEFIIGGIKSSDNSSLVNKLLEEKNLKLEAERREREARSLVLTQDAREAYAQKNYADVVRNLVDAYELDSTNYDLQKVYYKMMLEHDSLYFSQKLSEPPLPQQKLIKTDSSVISDFSYYGISVDYEGRKIFAYSDNPYNRLYHILDFNGNVLKSFDKEFNFNSAIFKNNRIYTYYDGKLNVYNDEFKKVYDFKINNDISINNKGAFQVSKDELIVIEESKGSYMFYKRNKKIANIKIENSDFVSNIFFDKNQNITFCYHKMTKNNEGESREYITYNLKGKKVKTIPQKDNFYYSFRNIFSSSDGHVLLTINNNVLLDEIQMNNDSIDYIFYINKSFKLTKEKFELRDDKTTYIKEVNDSLKISNSNDYPHDFLLLNDSIVVIAHKHDILIKSISSNKIISRFKINGYFVRMYTNGNGFYLLTNKSIQHISKNGTIINETKLPLSTCIDFSFSPKNETIIVYYWNGRFSVLNKNLRFKCLLFNSDDGPIDTRRSAYFLNEETFIINGGFYEVYEQKKLEGKPIIFNSKGEIIKILPGTIINQYWTNDNWMDKIIRIKNNHYILLTAEENTKKPYMYEINSDGEIIYLFQKELESYNHPLSYSDKLNHLDSLSFSFLSSIDEDWAYKWFDNGWNRVESSNLIYGVSLNVNYNIFNFLDKRTLPVRKKTVTRINNKLTPILLTDQVEVFNSQYTHTNQINIKYDDSKTINDSLFSLSNHNILDNKVVTDISIFNINSKEIIYKLNKPIQLENTSISYHVINEILKIQLYSHIGGSFSTILVNLTNRNFTDPIPFEINNNDLDTNSSKYIAYYSYQNNTILNLLNRNTLRTICLFNQNEQISNNQSYNRRIINIGEDIYVKTYNTLYFLDVPNKSLNPIKEFKPITQKNDFNIYSSKTFTTLSKEYYIKDNHDPDTPNKFTFQDSVFKHIEIPSNHDDDYIHVLFKKDKFIVLQNERDSYFFNYYVGKNRLEYLNKGPNYNSINFFNHENLFIGIKDNKVSILNNEGKHLVTLSFNRKILSANFYSGYLKIISNSDGLYEGEISLQENKNNVHCIPLIKNGLLNLKKTVLFE